MAIVEAISGAPDALRGFVYWLIFINTASVFFVFHRAEARWVLAVWAALVLLSLGLAEREIEALELADSAKIMIGDA